MSDTSRTRTPVDVLPNAVDIGAPARPGTNGYDPSRELYTLQGGSGSAIGDEGCRFVWRSMRGDFIVTAHGRFIGPDIHPQAELGWMARATLESGSPQVCASLRADGSVALTLRRRAQHEAEVRVLPSQGEPGLIQLERHGSTWIMSAAKFGERFSTLIVQQVAMPDEVQVGLYVASNDATATVAANFHNVRVVRPAGAGFDRERDPFTSRLEILDVDSGERRIVHEAPSVFEAPNWTRDGAAILCNQAGRLWRLDLATSAIEPIDTGDAIRNNNDHVISFDGRRLAISDHSGHDDGLSRIRVLPIEGGAPQLVTTHGPSYLHGWSPDGRFLVYTAKRGQAEFDIYRIAVEGGDEERLTETPGLDDGPEYAPDGRHIWFNSSRAGRMQIWRMRADGSMPEPMVADELDNWFAHVSPDGRRIVFLSYLVGEVEPTDHPAARRVALRIANVDGSGLRVVAYLYGGQGTINVPSWAPDSRRLAFVSNTLPLD